MSYTPNNGLVFESAYAGAFAGMVASGRRLGNTNPAVYAIFAEYAGTWAEAFDTVWGGAAIDQLIVDSIREESYSVWLERTPHPSNVSVPQYLDPNTWFAEVTAIIASITSAESYFTSQGIIPPEVGGGNPAALLQANWYIDPVAGKDTNDGKTAATAIKTNAEFSRRIGAYQLPGIKIGMQVHYLGDMPTDGTDQLNLETFISLNGYIRFSGLVTTVHTGTISAVTAPNPSTNTPASLTDSLGLAWAPYLYHRIDITAGTGIGLIGWADLDLGAGRLRTNPMSILNSPLGLAPSTPGTPSIGDTYSVRKLSNLSIGNVAVNVGNYDPADPNFLVVVFENFTITGDISSGADVLQYAGNVIYNTVGCSIPIGISDTSTSGSAGVGRVYTNCQFGNFNIIFPGASTFFEGGICQGSLNGINTGSFQVFAGNGEFSNGFMFASTATFYCSGGSSIFQGINSVSFFDAGIAAGQPPIQVGSVPGNTANGGTLVIEGSLWGSGNNGTCLSVGAGSTVTVVSGAILTMAGAADFSLAGATTGRAWNESLGGYTAALNCTWANFNLALGGGGFGGNAHNLTQNANLVKF